MSVSRQWRNYKSAPLQRLQNMVIGPLPAIEQFELHESRSLIESNVTGSHVNGG